MLHQKKKERKHFISLKKKEEKTQHWLVLRFDSAVTQVLISCREAISIKNVPT